MSQALSCLNLPKLIVTLLPNVWRFAPFNRQNGCYKSRCTLLSWLPLFPHTGLSHCPQFQAQFNQSYQQNDLPDLNTHLQNALQSKPEDLMRQVPPPGSDACYTGLLSAEHSLPRGSTSRQIKSMMSRLQRGAAYLDLPQLLSAERTCTK